MKNLEKWQARQSATEEDAWGIVVEGTTARPKWIIYPTKALDEQDAALIMAAHNAAVEKRPERSILVSSITNKNLEPIVQVVLGAEVAHFTVRQARQLISSLQESTEAAMSDALLTRFVRDYVFKGRDDDQAKRAIGSLLVMFREFRTAFDGPVVEASDEQ